MSAQRVVAFKGPVQVATHTRQLRLDGVECDVGRALTVIFGGCAPGGLPAVLHNVIITTDAALTPGRWQLLAESHQIELVGRSIHVQRPAADLFYQAVPGAPLTFKARAGWALLLGGLRVPGMTWVLEFFRSR